MKFTLARALLAVFVLGACGPSPPDGPASSTETTGSAPTSTTTPTTTMPMPDMGTEDSICPSLPPLTAGDCVPVAVCPETTVFTGDVVIAKAEDFAALASLARGTSRPRRVARFWLSQGAGTSSLAPARSSPASGRAA